MRSSTKTGVVSCTVLILGLCVAGIVFANGGPFVVKYPGGDPAAKGVLARLDPDLKPRHEARLRVVKEDLKITFASDPMIRSDASLPPLVYVAAEYTIENPTAEEIEIDFGFPILRGVYTEPLSMMPTPDVEVRWNGDPIPCNLISNSAIYGIIRQRARETIDKGIANNKKLAELVATVRKAKGADRAKARAQLAAYLTSWKRLLSRWDKRDAALMVEYASLDFGKQKTHARDRSPFGWGPDTLLVAANLGPLGAIGEQKATQFFAQLASHFDRKAARTYESIFTAWGGDVRERSVDLKTGKVRPREISVDPKTLEGGASYALLQRDPTIYARVDYLDPKAKISEAEKASCGAILKNLPVVFTFAPMNLLHYQVKFPAKSTQTLTVSYRQYAYADTRSPDSYQLAYVVHPASLWKKFGPINLEVAVPEGVRFRASVPCKNAGGEERTVERHGDAGKLTTRFSTYRATLKNKKGELFLAVDADAWKKVKWQAPQAAEVQARRG